MLLRVKIILVQVLILCLFMDEWRKEHTLVKNEHSIKSKYVSDGVIDRIIDGKYSVILLEEREEQIVIPVRDVPFQLEEGMWLILEEKRNGYFVVAPDQAKTDYVQEQNDKLLKKIPKKQSYFLKRIENRNKNK